MWSSTNDADNDDANLLILITKLAREPESEWCTQSEIKSADIVSDKQIVSQIQKKIDLVYNLRKIWKMMMQVH